MKKLLIALAIGLLPFSASASTLTTQQVGSIIGLLQAFGVDQTIITNVYKDLMPDQTTIDSTPIVSTDTPDPIVQAPTIETVVPTQQIPVDLSGITITDQTPPDYSGIAWYEASPLHKYLGIVVTDKNGNIVLKPNDPTQFVSIVVGGQEIAQRLLNSAPFVGFQYAFTSTDEVLTVNYAGMSASYSIGQ